MSSQLRAEQSLGRSSRLQWKSSSVIALWKNQKASQKTFFLYTLCFKLLALFPGNIRWINPFLPILILVIMLYHRKSRKSRASVLSLFQMFLTIYFDLIYPTFLVYTFPRSTLSFLTHFIFYPFSICLSLMPSLSSIQLMLSQSLVGIPTNGKNISTDTVWLNRSWIAVKWGKASKRWVNIERLWNGDLSWLSRTINPPPPQTGRFS